jgi:putative nucleotidyltransferase with HDIG domain
MTQNLLEKNLPSGTALPRKTIFDHLEDPRATSVLPSLQILVRELEALTRQGDSPLEDISQLIRMDQGMSLQVLRIANSAYYGPVSPIADVKAAILYIGLGAFRGALASTRCIETTSLIRQDILHWTAFWMHSAAVGQMTMLLAARLNKPELPPETFYMMGLLHDIGKVVLACLMPDEFNEIYSRAAAEKISPAVLELKVLGVEHGHLGAWYLERQGIPLTVREPVRFHHNTERDEKSHLRHAALIRLADLLVLDAGLGDSGNHMPVDPFASDEWKWYLETCRLESAVDAVKFSITTHLAETADLVREIIPLPSESAP